MKASWSAPSNIALIKYWGKKDIQLPLGPSLSFTLDKARSFVEIEVVEKSPNDVSYELLFQGQKAKPKFLEKFHKAWDNWAPHLLHPWPGKLMIKTHNNFPHSAGMASSASSYAAIALCLWDLQRQIKGEGAEWAQEDFKKVSELARLGSGSAARSIQGPLMSWGEVPGLEGSSQNYATTLPFEIPSELGHWRDAVLVVDEGEKKVSSGEGHRLMENHPYKEGRIRQSFENFEKILTAMKNLDWESFISIIENEALSLHALMMSSSPGYMLMNGKTLSVIEEIQHFRKQNSLCMAFTLDAGPNVHVLYPQGHALVVERWLHDLARDMRLAIHQDGVGQGAREEGRS